MQTCESTFCMGKRLYSICKCYKPKCERGYEKRFTGPGPNKCDVYREMIGSSHISHLERLAYIALYVAECMSL